MSPRELARVLLRVYGAVFLAYLVFGLLALVLQLCFDGGFARDVGWWYVLVAFASLAPAVLLLWKGNALADRLQIGTDAPAASASAEVRPTLDAPTAFRIGCALIGVYGLTRVAGSLATIVYDLLRRPTGVPSERFTIGGVAGHLVVEASVQLVFSGVLIVGPGRVGRWLRRTFTASRTPPEPDPR